MENNNKIIYNKYYNKNNISFITLLRNVIKLLFGSCMFREGRDCFHKNYLNNNANL